MELRLFVTCGRGLDDFVKDEIHEKIPRAIGIHSLGEGKVMFSVQIPQTNISSNHSDCAAGRDSRRKELGSQHLPVLTDALVPALSLKLVERIFLLLHCEDLGCLDIGESKLTNIFEELDLETFAKVALKMKTVNGSVSHALCYEASCPGIVNHITDKNTIREKRNAVMSMQHKIMNKKKHHRIRKRKKFVLDSKEDEQFHEKRKKMDCDGVETMISPLNNLRGGEHIRQGQEEILQDQLIKSAAEKHKCSSHDYMSNLQRTTKDEYSDIDHKDFGNKNISLSTNESSTSVSEVKNIAIPCQPMESCSTLASEVLESALLYSFRISCRIRGKHKGVLKTDDLTKKFVKVLEGLKDKWKVDWTNPDLDFYVNITDMHFLIGLSVSKESLSLRSYISHITLRSTTSYLMAMLGCLKPGDCILDPMCGGGTILVEASQCFKVGHAIGGDLDPMQLEVARCNLKILDCPYDLLHCTATSIPLNDQSVNAVVCDFPFGQKHKLVKSEDFLLRVIGDCCRLLVQEGRAVFLLSFKQREVLMSYTSKDSTSHEILVCSDGAFILEASYPISLGRTSACVVVLLKK